MAATELMCHSIGVNPTSLTKEELIVLEVELFARVCEELKEIFRQEYKDYFRILRFTTEKENAMLDSMLVRLVINDVLATDEYSLEGVAHYTDIHADVIQEVVDGRNTNPSAILLRRSIDLHRSVRRELYRSIMKKIAMEYLAVA